MLFSAVPGPLLARIQFPDTGEIEVYTIVNAPNQISVSIRKGRYRGGPPDVEFDLTEDEARSCIEALTKALSAKPGAKEQGT